MSKVKSIGTKPELIVRSHVHRLGFRFRVNVHSLPGSPDIVLPRWKIIIFVHGCFWHGHPNCSRSTRPLSNVAFWTKKLDSNLKRQAQVNRELRKLGWKVSTIWECETRSEKKLALKIMKLFS